MIAIGIKNKNINDILKLPNELANRVRLKTQTINLEKYNFYDFINYVTDEFDKYKKQAMFKDNFTIAIHKKIFNMFFNNQKERLMKNCKINPILELKITKGISKTSATKQIIKDTTEKPYYETSNVKNSARDVYIITQEHINILKNFSIADDDDNTNRMLTFSADEYNKLITQELPTYLSERKKYFKNNIE
jgi:hypothetical protein